MPQPYLDQTKLKAILRYSRRSGLFVWRRRSDVGQRWNTRYAGKVAGFSWSPDGGKNFYISIRIFDWPFLAHRLAVLYVNGVWPTNDVDHRDLDGQNNRWKNLREATKAQNGANRGPNAKNKTGYKGVCICSKTGNFRATLRGKHLGNRSTAKAAADLYNAAAKAYFGDFARTS